MNKNCFISNKKNEKIQQDIGIIYNFYKNTIEELPFIISHHKKPNKPSYIESQSINNKNINNKRILAKPRQIFQMKKQQEDQKVKQYIKDVMQKTFQQLWLQGIQNDQNILYQLKYLQSISQQLQNGDYLNVVGCLGLENTRVDQIKQKKLQKLLKSLDQYIDLLCINNQYQTSTPNRQKKPKKLKSRPQIKISQIKQQSQKSQKQQWMKQQNDLMKVERYFILFHDLECLRKIEFIPDQDQVHQTIQSCVDKIRDIIYDKPQRLFFTTTYDKIQREHYKQEQNQQVNYKQQYVINRKMNENVIEQQLNDVDDLQIEWPLEDMPDDQKNQLLLNFLDQPQLLEPQTQKSNQQKQSQYSISQSIAITQVNIVSQQDEQKRQKQNLQNNKSQQQSKKQQSKQEKLINPKTISVSESKQIKIEKTYQQQQSQPYEVDQVQILRQKSLILEHLSKLQDQLSQSLSQQSFIMMNLNNSYLQMNLDEILQTDQIHETLNINDTN